jgi:hypothetical protein
MGGFVTHGTSTRVGWRVALASRVKRRLKMTDPKPYDPKLKQAMKEIAVVMKKYDVGGMIELISPTHGEFRFFLDPSWSLMSWAEAKDGSAIIRYQHKKSKPKESTATAHLIMSLLQSSGRNFMMLNKIYETKLKPFINVDGPQKIYTGPGEG